MTTVTEEVRRQEQSAPTSKASSSLADYGDLPRPRPTYWATTAQDRDIIIERLDRSPFALEKGAAQKRRRQGTRLLLDWLSEYPGSTWQERWLASGADTAGRGWTEIPAQWLGDHGKAREAPRRALREAVSIVTCADVLRPSLAWLLLTRTRSVPGHMARVRDATGFARLLQACEEAARPSPESLARTRQRAAYILGAKGGRVCDITLGDVLEQLAVEDDVAPSPLGHQIAFYSSLRHLGVLGPNAPARLQQLRSIGQLSPEQLIDRYDLACRPVRDLLVEYLRERQPALDYSSLRTLAATLGNTFWKDLERHHPGIDSLRLAPDVAEAWKERVRTRHKPAKGRGGAAVTSERIAYREALTPIRAFYLDIAQWALEEPERWAHWSAPSPVRERDVTRAKSVRRRKARMDARTRARLPVLSTLLRAAEQRRRDAAHLLNIATAAKPGEPFTVEGHRFSRETARASSRAIRAWDLETGTRRNLGTEEDIAFWGWAVISVLSATGIRVEELLELTHHSLIRYRLPTTGEIVPLLQITPSKTDAERLLVVSPELAETLSAIIQRARAGGAAIPLIPAYDHHECLWLPAAPWLFQRRLGVEPRRISAVGVSNLLDAALLSMGITDPDTGTPLRCTPHDFRRIFLTDAMMSGLPPHIAQVIAGHNDINVTLGYKAVYPEEAIQAYTAFLARRRALRPTEEYRAPTEDEWVSFLGHFERRKVSIGTCGRAFSTPCSHEHACVRCPLLWPDPAQRTRLVEIEENLVARIAEAEREGWLGEVEGLHVSLAGARDKLAQIDQRRSKPDTTDLGIPTITTAGRTG